ncbi:hypothetical protein [Xanthomonas oryzae]|uniref:hypothetical protein n=1 Tax=Xanthomonas oryzae TaxID=347 RepID=UPI0011BE004A|nr:hypothetical protein [Xanthomonas oryzae]
MHALLQSAGIGRVLIVDDDLSRTVDLASLDRHGQNVVISDVLADANHDYTFDLDEELERLGMPHDSRDDRLAALKDPAVRALAHPVLQGAYERAMTDREALREPLEKIKEWLTVEGIELEEWTEARALPEADRYDLLVVDYFLMDNDPQATYKLIREFKQAHADRKRPLLVILMSSDIGTIRERFEDIRDKCEISASRFRILAKPVIANSDSDEEVKEKWLRALRQLATERPLVMPIERFVEAWQASLHKAAKQMVRRLYDLDASAFALLSATASQDSMKLEEYLADVLSRRVSAEAEEHGFPFDEIDALREALSDAQATIGPTIDQGVEVRHAQRAIRSLMSDVAWHRRPWWDPSAPPPRPLEVQAEEAAVAMDVAPVGDQVLEAEQPEEIIPDVPTAEAGEPAAEGAGTPAAVMAEALDPTHTEDRLIWMKRYIRFGTILREKAGAGRYFVNLTQACDVQSEKLKNVAEVHYLLIQGNRFPVDRVAVGEKLFDSPYYCDDVDSDEFFALQWRLRQPFTPSMATLLKTLEHYELVGQLRSDSAYAVLSKYLSQASRVAQIRMPKIYRYSASVYRKQAAGWVKQNADHPIEASAWQTEKKQWRIQFPVADARALLPLLSGVVDAKKPEFVNELIFGVEFSPEQLFVSKAIKNTGALLMRMDARAELDDAALVEEISKDGKGSKLPVGATVILTRALA